MKLKKLTITLGLLAAASAQTVWANTNQWVITPYESAAFAACKNPQAKPIDTTITVKYVRRDILLEPQINTKRHFCEAPSGRLISFVCHTATQSCEAPRLEAKSVLVFTGEVMARREQMRQEILARTASKTP